LHEKLKEIVQKERVSMNRIVNLPIAEKVLALLTEDYLKAQDKKRDPQKFKKMLEKVSDGSPKSYDEL
jgi:hypothetical protein